MIKHKKYSYNKIIVVYNIFFTQKKKKNGRIRSIIDENTCGRRNLHS